MMASGEVWCHSYDGVILLLIDTMRYIHSNGLFKHSGLRDILVEIKQTLKNMLFALVSISDKYTEARLRGLIHCVYACFRSVPFGDEFFEIPNEMFRFQLGEEKLIYEYQTDKKMASDPNVLLVNRRISDDCLIKEFADKQLGIDGKADFLYNCFINHLLENNLQIYDIFSFFETKNFFDACLKLKVVFWKYGFKFSYAVEYIEEVVYSNKMENFKTLNVNKLCKKISKGIQKSNILGKKMALREEKGKKLDANFEYVPDTATKPGQSGSSGIEATDAGTNFEAILLELKTIKNYSNDSILSMKRTGFDRLIEKFLSFGIPHSSTEAINAFDLITYFIAEFSRDGRSTDSQALLQIKFINEVFTGLQDMPEDHPNSSHLALFNNKLHLIEIDQTILSLLRRNQSVEVDIECFVLLVNIMQAEEADELIQKIISQILNQGDEIFHISKRIFSTSAILGIHQIIAQEEVKHLLAVKLCSCYLSFIYHMYAKTKELVSDEAALTRADRLSYYLIRRLCEFDNSLRTYFSAESNNLYVRLPTKHRFSSSRAFLPNLSTLCLWSRLTRSASEKNTRFCFT